MKSKKNILFRKKIIFLLIPLLFISSCGSEEKKQVSKFYNTSIVKTGSIDNLDNYVGYAEGISEVELSTKSSGKITFLEGKVGDRVKSGELLLSLDSSEAKVGVSTSNSIISTLGSLKNQTSISYDEQIRVIENKIEEIKESKKGIINNKSNLESLKKTELVSGNLLIKQAKTILDTNKLELEQSINIYNGDREDIFNSGKNVITNNIILTTNIIIFSDELLGITKDNKRKNDRYEDYLGKKDTIGLGKTKSDFISTNDLFLDYKEYYEQKIENKSPTNEEILLGLEKGLKISENIKKLLNSLYKSVDNSIDNVYFTLDEINKYKEKISIYGGKIEAQILSSNGGVSVGLKGTVESLASLERNHLKQKKLLAKKIDISNDSLETAKQNLNSINVSSTITTDNEKSKQDIAGKQILGLIAQINSINAEKNARLKQVDSSIKEVQGERNLAGVQIQNGNIYSPINGIIIKQIFEKGEIISAGSPIFIVGDDSSIKLKIAIGNDIVDKLIVGDYVDVKFEGLTELFKGKLTSIPTVKNSITKKTTIEVVIDNKNKKIKIGTIAKITIPLELDTNDGIIIPNKAILQKYAIPGVYVLENNKAIFKKINIVSQNEKNSEILGINIGEIIITDGKENIWDGENLE